jgi:hypothetical protein
LIFSEFAARDASCWSRAAAREHIRAMLAELEPLHELKVRLVLAWLG